MQRGHLLLFAVVAAVMFGSLAYTGGWAWHICSDAYRRECAAALGTTLALPSDIGRVVPRSRRSREFRDVVVWLPQRRSRALSCEQALVVWTPTAENPEAYEIQLSRGSCEVSTRTWLRQDYRRVVESGLRPGFSAEGPRRVTFSDMQILFDRDRFRAELRGADGQVVFEGPQVGRAAVKCEEFNGYHAARPVLLTARFSPHNAGIRIDQLDLMAPDLPFYVARLRDLAGLPLSSGTFNGRLVYEEHEHGTSLVISGKCSNLELSECTATVTPVPWRGRCPQVELQELRIENERPCRLRFRGVLTDVRLGDVMATWGLRDVPGTLTLEVGAADLSPGGIRWLVASGSAVDVSLGALTESLGWGVMTGRLTVTISDLTVEDNHLKSLDADLVVADATETPNWVEGRLLTKVVSRTLGVELPPILPERIEYTQLGLRLEVRDEVLYVFGTHGEGERTILTVRLYDRDLPLLFEPRRSFDLAPWFDELRAEAAEQLDQRLRVLSGRAAP